MTTDRDCVILAPGPLHLFWTAGVYYMWELSRKHNVVLVVDEAYRASLPFAKAATLAGVGEILYVPADNALVRHRFYAREFARLINEFKPLAIFHHDPVYVPMMYLYHLGRKIVPKLICASYLAGMTTVYWKQAFAAGLDFEVEITRGRLHLPRGLVRAVVELKGWISVALNYYLLPVLFLGKYFIPPMNVTNGKILKGYWNDQFDYWLFYSELDRKASKDFCGSEEGFVKIQHPLEGTGKEFNRLFYSSEEKDAVLIMPTYGFVNTYQRENNLSDKEVIAWLSSKWIEAIQVLKRKFPRYELLLKLHPSQEKDLLWKEIVSEIQKSCNEVKVVNPAENGQEWILRSKVVVSDFSSVLWWTSFFKSKVSISLDIFGTKYTDEMKYRDNVRYFNRLADFAKEDSLAERKEDAGNSSQQTITEFLDSAAARSFKL